MNLKNYVVAASLVLFTGAACASHTTTPVAVVPPPPAPVVVATPTPAPAPVTPVAPVDPLVASGDHFSFKVPDATWEVVDGDDLPEGVLGAAQNATLKARFMLLNEATDLNTAAFTKRVLAGLTQQGVKVLTTPMTVTVNGNQFAYVENLMGTIHVYTWIAVVDGQSYGVMCGSAVNAPNTKTACQAIVNTLTLK